MLKLIDLLDLAKVKLGKYKIHCASDNKQSDWRPLEAYFAGRFEIGQSMQSQPNFKCDHVVSMINLGNSKQWLFVGVYHVDGVRKETTRRWSGFRYSLSPLSGIEHLTGRTIIDFPKGFRASYLVGKKYEDRLEVSAIREEKMSIADFPGFNSVRLSFEMLQSIIRQDIPSWRTALANVAGVYVISDQSSGDQYVGSAYGVAGLWQRWTEYANTRHGGNKQLRELINRKGHRHALNFQFSILEVCDINAGSEYVISRESHWKDVLLTRKFGLN